MSPRESISLSVALSSSNLLYDIYIGCLCPCVGSIEEITLLHTTNIRLYDIYTRRIWMLG